MPVSATSSVLAGPPQQRRTPPTWSWPGRTETLASHQVRAGMRGVLGKFVDLKSLDGILELSWHTDQLHRVGAGLKPDLNRGRIATTLAMLRRNGTASFGRKRGL